jgi:DNA replication and repair protein RecF
VLERLVLKHFRNFASLDLPLQQGWHIFLGANGQGKTNLLEAFVLLAWGKSQRQGLTPSGSLNKSLHTHPLIYHPEWLPPIVDEAPVPNAPLPEASLTTQTASSTSFKLPSVASLLEHPSQTPTHALLEVTLSKETPTHTDPSMLRVTLEAQGKHSRLKASWDGKAFKKRGDLIGKIPCVAFFTEDLAMLRGTPSHRREWLERAMLQWQPQYQDVFQRYHQVLKQRNELLHQASLHGHHDIALLDVLTEQYIQVWWESLTLRLTYLETLFPWLQYYHARLANPQDGQLQCCYLPRLETLGLREGTTHPLTAAFLNTLQEEHFREELRQRRKEELRRGYTVVGTHKDDILWWLGTPETPWLVSQLGSQGQQRSVVLALKLAELATLAQRCKANQEADPILLLDDVMAELDPERQAKLLLALDTHASSHTQQVFLTTTHLHPSTLATLIQASRNDTPPTTATLPIHSYEVVRGTITPIPSLS